MRLDIETEAKAITRRINTVGRGARACSRKAVFFLDQMPRTFGIDTRSAKYYLEHHANRLIGVYDVGVTEQQIIEDLAQVMA